MFTEGNLQFFGFHVSFASLEFFSLWRGWVQWRTCQDPVVSRVYGAGFLSYFLAIFVWTIDLNFCWVLDEWLPAHGIPNPQLHAAWHVLVSNGFARLLCCLAWRRARDLGHARARITWRFGLLPTVEAGPEKAS